MDSYSEDLGLVFIKKFDHFSNPYFTKAAHHPPALIYCVIITR